MLSDQKLPGYRFPLSVIGHAVWLYHRCALSDRDVEELLFERGIDVSRESIRTWCINFSGEFAQNLRHREPRRGSRWHLDEMHVVVGGVTHWLWRAVEEHGAVLDVLPQRHRDTDAARSFFQRLLGEYDVPDTVCTDKLASDGAAIRERPILEDVDHQQVISSARCNNLIEQRAGVHRGVRSAQDSLTSPHDVRNGANWVSGRSGAPKDFSTCTPESPTFTALPAQLSSRPTDDFSWALRCEAGRPSYNRWPELQAICSPCSSITPYQQQLARTVR